MVSSTSSSNSPRFVPFIPDQMLDIGCSMFD
jgi:hypothetical protein